MKIARHILVPTDFSEAAEHALGTAVILARQNEARVTLAHVLSVEPLHIEEDELDQRRAERRERETLAHHELDARRAKLLEQQIPDVKTMLVRARTAADALCQIAEQHDVDLIVMATHGRTRLGRALLGSVAEDIVSRAPCPVFLCRAPSRKRPGSSLRPPAQDEATDG